MIIPTDLLPPKPPSNAMRGPRKGVATPAYIPAPPKPEPPVRAPKPRVEVRRLHREPELTDKQIYALKKCEEAEQRPISLADLPAKIKLETLRSLAERGLLQITVQISPYGVEALEVRRQRRAIADHKK